jgi:hypothetical protein
MRLRPAPVAGATSYPGHGLGRRSVAGAGRAGLQPARRRTGRSCAGGGPCPAGPARARLALLARAARALLVRRRGVLGVRPGRLFAGGARPAPALPRPCPASCRGRAGSGCWWVRQHPAAPAGAFSRARCGRGCCFGLFRVVALVGRGCGARRTVVACPLSSCRPLVRARHVPRGERRTRGGGAAPDAGGAPACRRHDVGMRCRRSVAGAGRAGLQLARRAGPGGRAPAGVPRWRLRFCTAVRAGFTPGGRSGIRPATQSYTNRRVRRSCVQAETRSGMVLIVRCGSDGSKPPCVTGQVARRNSGGRESQSSMTFCWNRTSPRPTPRWRCIMRMAW